MKRLAITFVLLQTSSRFFLSETSDVMWCKKTETVANLSGVLFSDVVFLPDDDVWVEVKDK